MTRTSNDRRASCYDLTGAGEVSTRLRHAPAGTPVPDEPHRYIRFSLSDVCYGVTPQVSTQTGAPELLEIEEGVPWSAEMMGSAGWERLIAWCASALSAKGAFVVDDCGLIVASYGEAAYEMMEEIGARLLMAFEHADQMHRSGVCRSISIQLYDDWVVGIRVPGYGDSLLTIGILAQRPLSQAARSKIETAFTKKALNM